MKRTIRDLSSKLAAAAALISLTILMSVGCASDAENGRDLDATGAGDQRAGGELDALSVECLQKIQEVLEGQISRLDDVIDNALYQYADNVIDLKSIGGDKLDDLVVKMADDLPMFRNALQARRAALTSMRDKVAAVIKSKLLGCVLGVCGTYFSMVNTADAAEWTIEDDMLLVTDRVQYLVDMLEQRASLLSQIAEADGDTSELEAELAELDAQLETRIAQVRGGLGLLIDDAETYNGIVDGLVESFETLQNTCVPLSCLSFCGDPELDNPQVFSTIPVSFVYDGRSTMFGSNHVYLTLNYQEDGYTNWRGEVPIRECDEPGDQKVAVNLTCHDLGNGVVEWSFNNETISVEPDGTTTVYFEKVGCDYDNFTAELNAGISSFVEWSNYAACDGPAVYDVFAEHSPVKDEDCEGQLVCSDTCAGSPECTSCPWDLSGNGEVAFDDFLPFSAAFGEQGEGLREDFDKSNQVDFPDFLQFAGHYGLSCPAD